MRESRKGSRLNSLTGISPRGLSLWNVTSLKLICAQMIIKTGVLFFHFGVCCHAGFKELPLKKALQRCVGHHLNCQFIVSALSASIVAPVRIIAYAIWFRLGHGPQFHVYWHHNANINRGCKPTGSKPGQQYLRNFNGLVMSCRFMILHHEATVIRGTIFFPLVIWYSPETSVKWMPLLDR